MDCREARRILWPADALRVGDDEVCRALEHAESCPTCHAFLDEDRRIAELIRDRVAPIRAPQELRERLFTALARERAGATPRPGRLNRGRAVAALIVLYTVSVGALGLWLGGRGGSRLSPAASFSHDYLRRVIEERTLETDDPERIADFFAQELGMQMKPPEVPGFHIDRAFISVLGSERGGVVEYRFGDRHLSYYVIPVEPERRPGAAAHWNLNIQQVSDVQRDAYAMGTIRGLAVATWRDVEHEHALVGNFRTDELRSLVPLFDCPLVDPAQSSHR